MALSAAKRLLLLDNAATRPGQLTLANVINDANDSTGLLHLPGATWVGPAVANIATDPVGATGATGAGVGNLLTETNIAYSSQAGESTGYSGITTAVKGVADGSAGTLIYSWVVATTPTIGATYTAKIKIRASAGGVGRTVALRWRAVGGGTGNAYVGTSDGVVLTAAYQTVTVSGTVDTADRATLYVRVEDQAGAPANGDTFYATVIMLETGAVANPFTATSRSAGRIQMPWDRGICTEAIGWAAGLVRMGHAYNSGVTTRLFQFLNSGTERIILQHVDNDAFYFERAHSGSNPSARVALSFALNDAVMWFAKWTPTDVLLSINGGAFASAGGNTAIPTLTTTFFDIGSNAGGGQQYADQAWCVVGNGLASASDPAAVSNAFGSLTRPKPTIRSLDQVARGAHAMAVWDGRTGTFQRRIGA